MQNVGAYGQTLGDKVSEVEAVETATGQIRKFRKNECDFVYRNSFFKRNPNLYIVTGFTLQLQPNGKSTVGYRDIEKHFAGKKEPTLSELREFIIRLRASKGYLIMRGHTSYNTAGSYFKNPLISEDIFRKLKPLLGDISRNRFWETSKGYKIAAAFLVQEAGFGKGYQEGHVGISPKHSLSLVNFGGGTAKEIKTLAEKIKQAVFSRFGVQLEEEVLLIGKF